jgi:hypothetical protein
MSDIDQEEKILDDIFTRAKAAGEKFRSEITIYGEDIRHKIAAEMGIEEMSEEQLDYFWDGFYDGL